MAFLLLDEVMIAISMSSNTLQLQPKGGPRCVDIYITSGPILGYDFAIHTNCV